MSTFYLLFCVIWHLVNFMYFIICSQQLIFLARAVLWAYMKMKKNKKIAVSVLFILHGCMYDCYRNGLNLAKVHFLSVRIASINILSICLVHTLCRLWLEFSYNCNLELEVLGIWCHWSMSSMHKSWVTDTNFSSNLLLSCNKIHKSPQYSCISCHCFILGSTKEATLEPIFESIIKIFLEPFSMLKEEPSQQYLNQAFIE